MSLKTALFDLKQNPENSVVVIYWPTACWKTDLSIEVAKLLWSEIISTDSQQIFKGLDIWTWKISKEEKAWVKHHMIDIIEPSENYSVWEFKNNAEKIIDNLAFKGKVPVLVWWTGLYIDSLIFDFNIPKIPQDEDLRHNLENFRLENWNQKLWDKLNEIDPKYALELHPNNYRYVIRWIEVKTISGKSKLDFRQNKKLKKNVVFITPYDNDREKLYARINYRVEKMFEKGLVWEVEDLLKFYSRDDFWMKSIWYKEVVSFLNGEISKKECIELIQKNSRNYAKRQITWFNKYKNYDAKIFEWVSRLW